MNPTDERTPVQMVIDAIREKVEMAYDTEGLELSARMAIDDILDEIESEGWK